MVETVVSPEEAQAVLDKMLSDSEAQVAAAVPIVKTTAPPPSTTVMLPGGYAPYGSMTSAEVAVTAEVRELTGADEEAISRAPSFSKALRGILERGVVSVGSESASKQILDELLSGDVEALVVGVRRVTFGDTIDVTKACEHCGVEQEFTIDLTADIPVKTLEDPLFDRAWEHTLKNGTVVQMRLPTGVTQRKLMDASQEGKTLPEMNSILLGDCVKSFGEVPSLGADTARKMSMAAREALLNDIIERNPGPRLGEVSKTCVECEKTIALPLSVSDLFRF